MITASALVGACVAGDRDPQLGERASAVDVQVAAVQDDSDTEDAGEEAVRLYIELATRLDERGVTPEEMQAAIDAGDEEAIREMFGFSPEEYEDTRQRLLAVAAGADPGETPAELEDLRCKGTWAPCFVGAAWWGRSFAGSGYLALAIFAVSALGCAWQACDWDEGRRWKQP